METCAAVRSAAANNARAAGDSVRSGRAAAMIAPTLIGS